MRWTEILVSAMTVFMMVAGNAFSIAVISSGDMPKPIVCWLCVITGLTAMGKDIRAIMSLPPLSNGNYDAIAQLMNERKAKLQNEKPPVTPPAP